MPESFLFVVYGMVGIPADTRIGQSCLTLMDVPLAEATLTPLPHFMTANGLTRPLAGEIKLTTPRLRAFARRSAGVRSMVNLVYARIRRSVGLRTSGRDVDVQLCRKAASQVLHLTLRLQEAEEDSHFESLIGTRPSRQRRPTRRARPRPSTQRPVWHGGVRIEGSGSSRSGGDPLVSHLYEACQISGSSKELVVPFASLLVNDPELDPQFAPIPGSDFQDVNLSGGGATTAPGGQPMDELCCICFGCTIGERQDLSRLRRGSLEAT